MSDVFLRVVLGCVGLFFVVQLIRILYIMGKVMLQRSVIEGVVFFVSRSVVLYLVCVFMIALIKYLFVRHVDYGVFSVGINYLFYLARSLLPFLRF